VTKKLTRVFVYGTLKRGYSNHVLLHDSKLVCERAFTADRFAMIDVGFPVILQPEDGRPAAQVLGEVYAVNERILQRLDQLEGNGRMYQRSEVVVHAEGETFPVNVYIGIGRMWDRLRDSKQQPDGQGYFEWFPRRRDYAGRGE
jgi:gamma-glutamylcyclotransferase (GGCT)/AIG2-like uncharacterized protein YtfP